MAKAAADIRSLARSQTDAAVRTLVAVMRQRKAPAAARVSAACALLDRGWGRPDKIITAEVSPNNVMLELLRAVGRGDFVGKELPLPMVAANITRRE